MGGLVWLLGRVQHDIELTLYLDQRYDTRHDCGGTIVRA